MELIEVEAMTGSLEQATEAELLRALLAARDVPCPVCAYNLRRITSANCPECGATLQLRLGIADLRFGPWLVALIAMALPLGGVGLVSIGLVINFWRWDMNRPDMVAQLVSAVAILGLPAFYTFGLRCLIRDRRKFWAKPHSKQRRIAVYHILATPGLIGLVVSLVYLTWFIAFLYGM